MGLELLYVYSRFPFRRFLSSRYSLLAVALPAFALIHKLQNKVLNDSF